MRAEGNTVLILDDSPTDLYVYSRALREAGFRPLTTLIGADTFGLHHNERPELVLLDYELNSGISAPQLVKVLRESFPSSLIVMFSVLTELPSDMKGLVDGLVPKGDTVRLITAVRNLLDHGSKGAAAKAAN